MSFKGVIQDFPFDQHTMVFKVREKMFLLVNIEWWANDDQRINVKCDPKRAIELRNQYESVKPGYHMSKKHWNTIEINDGELSSHQIFELIDDSYDLVVKKLPQKDQKALK